MGRVSGGGAPSLFQVREPRRRFGLPVLFVLVLHLGVYVWTGRSRVEAQPQREPVKVVFKLPVQKVAVHEPAGGGPKIEPPRARHHRRHPVRTPKEIPPPVVEPPTPPPPEPPALAEADEGDDTDDGSEAASGSGTGGGTGTGSGPATGSGRGAVASKARKAWVSHTDWKCRRPGYDELGRIVVRIKVLVQSDGHPSQVLVVKPGPDPFNRRAIDCARDETYLPALDPEGHPIPGDCEFGIEFLN
jgi:outer membrane biosynthesis protein TonB